MFSCLTHLTQPFALQILPPRSQRPVYQHRRLPDSYRNPTLHRLLRFVQWTRHSEGPPQANRRCRWHDFLRGPRWVTGVVRFTYIDYVGYVSFHRQRLQQYNPMIGNCEWRTILLSTYRHCIHESCSQGANSQSPKTSEHKPTEPSFEKSQACIGTLFFGTSILGCAKWIQWMNHWGFKALSKGQELGIPKPIVHQSLNDWLLFDFVHK